MVMVMAGMAVVPKNHRQDLVHPSLPEGIGSAHFVGLSFGQPAPGVRTGYGAGGTLASAVRQDGLGRP